ncbi:MAG: branched-chain amino acid ABC transporter permease [Gammaproteobacteria bacterium]
MEYYISVITVMAISVIFALSLNLITGFCGQISLGHAAFYGTGAYCAAMVTKAGGPFVMALLLAMVFAAVLGLIVGLASLRVKHDFLAITTMGVGFLFLGIVRKQDFLGGELGIAGIPATGLGKAGFMALALVVAAGVVLLSVYIKRAWMGYVFDAIADDEDAARMVGIDVGRFKLTAFALGTAIAGLAGALYAHDVRFIDPDSFGFVESITVLAMVVVGGIGSVAGVVAAAAVLSVLPLWLQFIADYKLLMYGLLVFVVMRFSPGGLAGLFSSAWNRVKSQ